MDNNSEWPQTLVCLDRGDFSRLEALLGGPDGFEKKIVQWFDEGAFEDQPEMLAEALSCSCMLGHTETARYLIDAGVDPYAGLKTGLAGPHYAVSGGHIELLEILLAHDIPLEIENQYGGTLLGQALWSAVNEPSDGHAEIIRLLVEAGAEIEPGTLEWWNDQKVRSASTKKLVSEVLRTGMSRKEEPKL